jgi:solute carrier family 25 phosphate transporter 3
VLLLLLLLLCAALPAQVAVQTRPGFAKGLSDGMPKLVKAEGAGT